MFKLTGVEKAEVVANCDHFKKGSHPAKAGRE